MLAAFLVIALALVASNLHAPGVSPGRRVIGAIADLGGTSLLLGTTGSFAAPWWWLYLWVTFGNGFRYGVRYLALSTALACVGFATAALINPFWHNQPGLTLGLLATLIILPGYVAVLLRRLDAQTQRARAASRAKSTFLANMSHEIRTPMAGVMGILDILQDSGLSPRQESLVETARTSAQGLLSVINSILDLSKVEAGRLAVEPGPFDLHALLTTVLRGFAPQAEAKGLHLQSQIAPETPFALIGDPGKLRQVLVNLLGNAIKFTAVGSVELRCHPVEAPCGRTRIRFQVLDTGIGIPIPAQPQVFEPFTQADQSVTRRFDGTGLGTTIAKTLVELMGGQIGFHSTPQVGTTFWFDLEFARQEHATPEHLPDCRVLRLRPPAQADGEVSQWLQGWGIASDTVASLAAAHRRLADPARRGSAEVLLLERFPLDGETTTFLATLGDDPSLTLIVLPAASDADSAKARLPGRAHVLSEPLDKTHLFNALHASHQRAVGATVVSLTERMERRSLLARVAGLRVLVAEDHPTNRLVIGHILEQAGVRCRLVEDGQQALDALEAEHFDLAILDMHLPNLGGIEAFQLYRFAHAGASPQLPFILLTANALAEARAQAQAAGIDYFMTKPFLSADLLRTIAEATGGATAPAGTPPAPAVPTGQIDPAPLADLFAVASSRDFGKQLVAGFEADGRGLLAQMTAALEAGDGYALRERAHALQGSAAALGLLPLRDQARRLHAANEETLRTEGHGLVAEIAEAFDPALLRLREEVAIHLGR